MSVALPAGADGEGASTENKVDAALRLISEALELLDASSTPPELLARVQEALDALTEHRSASR